MERQTNREHVVAIAADLFLSRGVATTSMDDVVRKSGVAKSNIYYHFKSKDELLLAVVDHRIQVFEQAVLAPIARRAPTSLMESLRLFVEAMTSELMARDCVGGCPFITLAIQAAGTNDLVRQRVDRFFADQTAQLEFLLAQALLRGEVRPDIQPAEAAGLLMSTIEGSLVLSEVTRDASLVQRRGFALLELLRPT